jgi:hypothetical protein
MPRSAMPVSVVTERPELDHPTKRGIRTRQARGLRRGDPRRRCDLEATPPLVDDERSQSLAKKLSGLQELLPLLEAVGPSLVPWQINH